MIFSKPNLTESLKNIWRIFVENNYRDANAGERLHDGNKGLVSQCSPRAGMLGASFYVQCDIIKRY